MRSCCANSREIASREIAESVAKDTGVYKRDVGVAKNKSNGSYQEKELETITTCGEV